MSSEIVRLEPPAISLLLDEASKTPALIRNALTVRGFTVLDAELRLTRPGHAIPMPANSAVVLVNVTDWGEEPSEAIRRLNSIRAARVSNSRLLCFSTARHSPRFVLDRKSTRLNSSH